MKTHCQSCGMPMEKDLLKGGTEEDGTYSIKYCSNCYQNGKFIDQDCTLEKMMQKVDSMTKELGLPESHRKIAINAVMKLERWKK